MSIYLGDTPITGATGANKDLSNLSSTGKNIANWSNNVTNCITEIPQDIKLELNNGTLTLKAGSKVYVPNGFEADGTTPKFDLITTSFDLTYAYTGANTGTMFIAYDTASSSIFGRWWTSVGSGTSTPSTSWWLYYNTNDNICYNVDNTTGVKASFPICAVTVLNNNIQSIDQVFNGFGYIGSTVFALPGVKGLIPNGRNADGTLKNIEFTTSNMLTFTSSGGFTGDCYLCLNANYLERLRKRHYSYDKDKNINYIQGNISLRCYTGDIHFTVADKIDRVSLPQAFHALDYNDSSTISGWSMPSSRYIDLTLGASGSTYTAPANGYLFLSKDAGSDWYYCNIVNTSMNLGCFQSEYRTSPNTCCMPAKKGDIIRVDYNATGATRYFKFIYAEGESNV